MNVDAANSLVSHTDVVLCLWRRRTLHLLAFPLQKVVPNLVFLKDPPLGGASEFQVLSAYNSVRISYNKEVLENLGDSLHSALLYPSLAALGKRPLDSALV